MVEHNVQEQMQHPPLHKYVKFGKHNGGVHPLLDNDQLQVE